MHRPELRRYTMADVTKTPVYPGIDKLLSNGKADIKLLTAIPYPCIGIFRF